MIELVHPAVRRLSDKVPLSSIIDPSGDGSKLCTKVSTFVSRVCKGAGEIEKNWVDYYSVNDFKGHALEVLVEFWLKSCPFDNRLGVVDYTPVIGSGSDYGVDGVGKSLLDNTVSTAQVKFRSNTEKFLTANDDHISNFVAHSYADYFTKDMPTLIKIGQREQSGDEIDNLLIITTAKDLHPVTAEKMYNRKVRTINYENMCSMLNGCELFWQDFYQCLVNHKG